jgi:hypothetical protein
MRKRLSLALSLVASGGVFHYQQPALADLKNEFGKARSISTDMAQLYRCFSQGAAVSCDEEGARQSFYYISPEGVVYRYVLDRPEWGWEVANEGLKVCGRVRTTNYTRRSIYGLIERNSISEQYTLEDGNLIKYGKIGEKVYRDEVAFSRPGFAKMRCKS